MIDHICMYLRKCLDSGKEYFHICLPSSHCDRRQRLSIQRYFTCVLTLCCFFSCKLERNPLMTANKVHHSSFSYQIFTMQVKAAIQVCCVQRQRHSAKKEQKHVRQSTFFSLSPNALCDTNDILYQC